MISRIQERKLAHLFDVLDTSKNKCLTPEDFTLVADRISDILGYPNKSRNRLHLELRSFRLFVQLLTDLEKEETSITYDEWMHLFRSALTHRHDAITHYVHRIAGYIFTLFDHNSDQVVSEKEFIDMFAVYNIPEQYVKIAFKKLDENSDGVLSKEEVIGGFHDFFISEDKEAKGNWIFGDWEHSHSPE